MSSNINLQLFSNWLGIVSNEHLDSSTCFVESHEIGEVRVLFERIVRLDSNDRKQVMRWGLHVKDSATLLLIIWGTLRLQNEVNDLQIDITNVSGSLRKTLFSPYIYNQSNMNNVDTKKASQENPVEANAHNQG